MNKRMNIIFFSICFIASIMAEAYCFLILKGELISSAGIGIVVLINGYLLLDSIRSTLKTQSEMFRFYLDHFARDEMQKWNEKYTEITNLQKASYTVSKKHQEMFLKQSEEMLRRMETIENRNIEELQKIIILQEKTMEGMKKALQMSVNYNRENTRQMVKVYQDNHKSENLHQLEQVILILHENNEQLKLWGNYLENIPDNMKEIKKHLEVNETLLAGMDQKQSVFDNTIKDIFSEGKEFLTELEKASAERYNHGRERKEEDEKCFSTIDDLSSMKINQVTDTEDEYNSFIQDKNDYFIAEETENDAFEIENNDYMGILQVNMETEEYADKKERVKTAEYTEEKETIRAEEYAERNNLIDSSVDMHTKVEVGNKENSEGILEEYDISTNEKDNGLMDGEDNKVVPLYPESNKKLTAEEIAALFASAGK